MITIVIANWAKKTLEINDASLTMLRHFHDNGLDWMHACGGKGRCTTCKAIIIDGKENFEALTAAEQKYRALNALSDNERLCCQAKITGNVVIAVPEQYKLPHINYNL